MRAKIYYGDGSTVKVDSTTIFQAPRVNVQCINLASENSREGFVTIKGKDLKAFFVFRTDCDQIMLCDEAGYNDYMMNLPGPKYVLYGRSMGRDADFWAMYDRAHREGLGD